MGQIITFPRTNNYNGLPESTVDRVLGLRYGNTSKPRIEIRYGDDSKYKLVKVMVDYLKTPLTIKLTQDQLDSVDDNSLLLEFPDYVCNEIVNEIVHIIMENALDLRVSSHATITQSIASPSATLSS